MDNGGHIWKTLGFMGLYYIFIALMWWHNFLYIVMFISKMIHWPPWILKLKTCIMLYHMKGRFQNYLKLWRWHLLHINQYFQKKIVFMQCFVNWKYSFTSRIDQKILNQFFFHGCSNVFVLFSFDYANYVCTHEFTCV